MPISSFSANRRPEVHGHRGCRGLFPENTIPGFLHALALGVDVLELDVVVSQDQQVVVAHDFWLAAHLGPGPAGEPISPQNERSWRLYEMPYAAIRQCTVGLRPQRRFPQQQQVATYRPLLRELLQAVEAASQQLPRSPVGYAIELKSTPTGDGIYHPAPEQFVGLVAAEVLSAGVQARTRLLSFDPRVLQSARLLAPQLPVCLLVEAPFVPQSLFGQLGFVPDIFGPDYRLVSPALLQQLRATHPALQVVPWTVNSQAALQRGVRWGVTGITTDYPNRLLALLNK